MALPAETGLGTEGVRNARPGGVEAFQVERMQGWQPLRLNPDLTTPDDSLTDLSEAPADAVELPDEGQVIEVRVISDAGNAIEFELALFPFAADDAEPGAAAGWRQTVRLTTLDTLLVPGFADASLTFVDPSDDNYAASLPWPVNRLGAHKLAGRVTSLGGNDWAQLVYRVV